LTFLADLYSITPLIKASESLDTNIKNPAYEPD